MNNTSHQEIIGRDDEITLFNNILESNKSAFVALYGRRRIGKTYLIRTFFKNKFTFQLTGLANTNLETQLSNFNIAVNEQYPKLKLAPSSNWLSAFQKIKSIAEKSKQHKKVIFLDELPWLDTMHSGFMQALEHFWNSWASARKDILLIVCGSAASWMINELINNKGGLHNRVTHRLKIEPFTLNECELFLKSKKINLDQYHIIQLYMVMGGIPFYWDEVKKGYSATQIIDQICFSKNGLLRSEFNNIFKSLFNKDEKHQAIIETLAKKGKGLSREEIISSAKLSNGGSITRLLNELEESGFIRKYVPYGKVNRNSLYQLSDFYSLFYFKFIKQHQLSEKNYWTNNIDNPKHRAWSGYAFEQVCLYHSDQIKIALGINGIETQISSWRNNSVDKGAQIDLVIDRRDQVVNLCEMKFSIHPYIIDKKYDEELRNKIGQFKSDTKTKKSVLITFISTYGISPNKYSYNIQNDIKMDALFIK